MKCRAPRIWFLNKNWDFLGLAQPCFYYYYYYYLFYHSLCWCSFCASAGRKPCTWSRSVTEVNHSVHTLSTLLRIRADQQAGFLSLCHSSSLWHVFLPFISYCTKRTSNHRDHFGFHLPHSLYSKIWESRCCYADTSQFSGRIHWSLTMMSGLFAVIVLSVLTGMSHLMVLLLSLLCIIVSGLSSYHLSVISISWSLQMPQWRYRWRYTAALLCLETWTCVLGR